MKKIILPLVVIAASGAYVWSQQGRIAAENVGGDATSIDASASTVGQPAPLPAKPATPEALKSSDAAPVTDPVPVAGAEVAPATVVETARPIAPSASLPAPSSQPEAVLPMRPTSVPAQSEAAVPPATVDVPLPLPRPRTASPAAAQITLAAATVPSTQPTGQYKDGSYDGTVTDAYYGEVQVEANVRDGKLATVKILQYPNDRRTSRYINSQALPILKQEAIQAQSGDVDFVSGATLTSRAYVASLSDALDQARQ